MSTTFQVIEFARRNHGVITTQEAEALGMTRRALAIRVDNGIFVRVARGLLALPGASTRPDLMLRAAHRILGAVVSHESAGRIHGFQPLGDGPPTLTVSHRSTHSFPGVTVHQSTDLLESHLVVLQDLRVTSPSRTIVDLSKTTGARRLGMIVEGALAARIVELDALAELFAAVTRKGKPGVRKLRRVLEELGGEIPIASTELESRLTTLLIDAGLPSPVRQFQAPWLRPAHGRVDLAYLGEQIVIEADSRRWHTLNDAFETDRQRDNAAQLAGWIVLRFTWRMITDDPMSVVDIVRHALRSRSRVRG